MVLNFKILGVIEVFDNAEFISTIKNTIQTLPLQEFLKKIYLNSNHFWSSKKFLHRQLQFKIKTSELTVNNLGKCQNHSHIRKSEVCNYISLFMEGWNKISSVADSLVWYFFK